MDLEGGEGEIRCFFNGKSHDKVLCIFSISLLQASFYTKLKCCTGLIEVVRCKSQKSKIICSAGEIIIRDNGRPVADKCTMHNLPEPGQKIKVLIMKYTVSLFLGVKNGIWNFGLNSKAKTNLYCQCSPIMIDLTPAGRYDIEDVNEVFVFIDVYCSWQNL